MEEKKGAMNIVRQISEVGRAMLAFQDGLAAEYGYKPIGFNLFLGDVREKYKSALPEWCNMTGDEATPLFSLDGRQICSGYDRIVIGDYGAFVEIAPGKEGLVHISKLDTKRVERVEDVVAVGDAIVVKVTDIDQQGRINLSRRDAILALEAKRAAQQQ